MTLCGRVAIQVSVKVTNITKKVTAEQLRDLFGQFGTITSLNLRPAEGYSKPHCFINFSMPEEAAEAIKEMNNYVGLSLS